MRFASFRLCIALLLLLPATPGRAFSDAELIDGFMRTVFGSEYRSWGWQSNIVKKFAGPVRVYVDDRSAGRRGGEVVSFVRSLPALISGLEIGIVTRPQEANYRVFVLDRADYSDVVSREIYHRPASSFAPGKCLVRVVSTVFGISRSDAAIVADEGDVIFKGCMVEEVLQGLGPVNDDRTLVESVFNDRSRNTTFTSFDRHLLNMLYHPLVRPGMRKREVSNVLPLVAADVRERLRR